MQAGGGDQGDAQLRYTLPVWRPGRWPQRWLIFRQQMLAFLFEEVGSVKTDADINWLVAVRFSRNLLFGSKRQVVFSNLGNARAHRAQPNRRAVHG